MNAGIGPLWWPGDHQELVIQLTRTGARTTPIKPGPLTLMKIDSSATETNRRGGAEKLRSGIGFSLEVRGLRMGHTAARGHSPRGGVRAAGVVN